MATGYKVRNRKNEDLKLDAANRCLILDVDQETLENAPGFDKDNWPNFADRARGATIYEHYRATPYWM
jgi:surface antigen